MLEVASGKKPVDDRRPHGREHLRGWVVECFGRDDPLPTSDIIDARLGRAGVDYEELEAVKVLKLGILCSSYSEEDRPSMREVVHYLNGQSLPDLTPNNLVMGPPQTDQQLPTDHQTISLQ